jgi:putative ABC transport system substrate-binding protein
MQFGQLKRREFITLFGGATAALPLAARAQQNSSLMRRVGVLVPYAESQNEAWVWYDSFVQGMYSLGWSEGRNLRLDVRWAGANASHLPTLARELVDLKPDAVFAMTTPAVNAVRRASAAVPIVFTQVTDPVAQGMVESLARPGGNITGITIFEPEIGGKWVQVLKEVAPRTDNVAVIFNPDTALYYRLYMRSIEAAAASLAMKTFEAPTRNRSEIEAAISALAHDSASGLIAMSDGFVAAHSELIIELTAQYRLPAIYFSRFMITGGGLISYGRDEIDMQQRAASLVDAF